MYYNKIKKITLNYQKYNNILFFSIKDNDILKIQSFFGFIEVRIPSNLILKIENDTNLIIFFYSKNFLVLNNILKSFCNQIIFFSQGLLFNHFVKLDIMGIGYKFELNKDSLAVYSGNTLPTFFNGFDNKLKIINDDLKTKNCTKFYFSGGDFCFLNNYAKKIRKISIPNKYKKIGIFFNKIL